MTVLKYCAVGPIHSGSFVDCWYQWVCCASCHQVDQTHGSHQIGAIYLRWEVIHRAAHLHGDPWSLMFSPWQLISIWDIVARGHPPLGSLQNETNWDISSAQLDQYDSAQTSTGHHRADGSNPKEHFLSYLPIPGGSPFGCSTFGRFQPNWFCYKWRLLRSAFPQLLPPWLVLVKNPMVELFNVTNIIISRGAFRGPSIQPNPIIQIRSHNREGFKNPSHGNFPLRGGGGTHPFR